MSDFTTELMNALQKNFPLNEFFRQQLESAVNGLLQSEITAFLGYEKHSSDGWNSGNSRNGSYVRTLTTSYGDLRILVPRDRNGLFAQKTIPRHTQHTDALKTTVIQPNEDSLERFVCAYYSEYNRKSGDRVQKDFQEATPLLLDMFP